MQTKWYHRCKNVVLWPLDRIYAIVCGKLDCPYCTFYRGVVLGLTVGYLVAQALA